MTPDHLGGLSIITWSLSVLIIEGGKPERQRKHGEGSGGGQAGGRGPGAAEASGSYKGRGVPPLELPRDPFGACDLQDRQVINPACFQPLGLRSFGTVAVENEHTLLYLESQLLSGAPHGPPPSPSRDSRLPPAHLPLLCAVGQGPGTRRGYRGPGTQPGLAVPERVVALWWSVATQPPCPLHWGTRAVGGVTLGLSAQVLRVPRASPAQGGGLTPGL